MGGVALQIDWQQKVCDCDLSDEVHYRYVRSDLSMVTRDHGESGVDLRKSLYVSGPCVGDVLTGLRSPDAAMRAIDLRWPLMDGEC